LENGVTGFLLYVSQHTHARAKFEQLGWNSLAGCISIHCSSLYHVGSGEAISMANHFIREQPD
jgi:hypothetical protein